MAKKSSVARNSKRALLAVKYAALRTRLKAVLGNPKSTDREFFDARRQLTELPRNSSPIRVRNRCSITGRPRGFHGRFGVSRLVLREMVAGGYIPGVMKSSW
ncbi:MAG: 30S ribosomal protein S14 [Puniceicoccales bacterium]|jgi:small subunit ribosomal protein S14|nr:30S ribosomal protein S14 [Puniceicoccales bacterium]